MAGPVAALTLLLPARHRFGGQVPDAAFARRLARADRLPDGEPGEQAQLLRHLELLPRGWPMAAITRQHDAGDAHLHAWLRADPAHVRPDMTGVRVLAIGELGLTPRECEALLRDLRPVFGDAGFQLSAPVPSRWYLALPPEARLPAFRPPEQVLGDDLFQHLPDGPEGRRWRALLTEAQVILHHHPVNAARTAAGRPTVNSLCFWGFGRLPDHVRTPYARIESEDVQLRALAGLAGAGQDEGPALADLRALRNLADLGRRVEDALAALGRAPLRLDFADGVGFDLHAGQRWRLWRRARAFAG